jgi:hypothetical protein
MKLRRWVKLVENQSCYKFTWRQEQVRRSDIIIGIGLNKNATTNPSSSKLTLFLHSEFIGDDLCEKLRKIIPGYTGGWGSAGNGLEIQIHTPKDCNNVEAFVSHLVDTINKLGYPLPLEAVNDIRANWNLPPVKKAITSLKELCINYAINNYSTLFNNGTPALPAELNSEIGLPTSPFILIDNNEKIDLAELPYKTIVTHIKDLFNQLTGNESLDHLLLGGHGFNDRDIHLDITETRFIEAIRKLLDENNILYTIEQRGVYDKFYADKKVSCLNIKTLDNNAEKLVLVLKNRLDNNQLIDIPPDTKTNDQPNGWLIKRNILSNKECSDLVLLNTNPEANVKELTFFKTKNGDILLGLCFQLTQDKKYASSLWPPLDKKATESFTKLYQSLVFDNTQLSEKPHFPYASYYNFTLVEKSRDRFACKERQLTEIPKIFDIVQKIDPMSSEILTAIYAAIPNLQSNDNEHTIVACRRLDG